MRISRISFVLFSILTLVVSVCAQQKTPPKIEWQKCVGGAGNESARSIQQTTDGGYIVAGYTTSNDGDVTDNHGYYDCWVVKLSNLGAIEWGRCFGGSNDDQVSSIVQTVDGGYIFTGLSNSNDGDVIGNHGNYDYWVVKLTSVGEIEWQKSLGGTGRDRAYSILQTTEGGYIVVGYSSSNDGDVSQHNGDTGTDDGWIVKLTTAGVIVWEKSFGEIGNERFYSIQQTTDGGYIVAGSNAYYDYWVLKMSETCEVQWHRAFGGSGNDNVTSIEQTVDSGYIVAGDSRSNDGDVTDNHGLTDSWIVKLTADGDIKWEKCIGGSSYDEATAIRQSTDGGYIMAGRSGSIDGDVIGKHNADHSYDFWIVKLVSEGMIEWQKPFGGSSSDAASSIQQTKDGGYIVAGYSRSTDGDVVNDHSSDDFWIVKLSPENPSSVESESTTTQTATITPNPASSSATLTFDSDEVGACEVQIISLTGATLKEYSTHLSIGKQEIALWGLASLPSGVYEVVMKSKTNIIVREKLTIIR